MTITFTITHLYITIIVVLMVLQIIQWRAIRRVHRENETIWEQVGVLAASIANQLLSIQKELNSKQDKNAG